MQSRELKQCAYCGKIMERKRYSNGELECWTFYNKRKYCNRECMKNAFRSRKRRGTSWMAVHQYARLLKPTGSCERCGSNRNVDVHHIDGNPQNNSLDNLQRLCRSCHIKAHRVKSICSICGKEAKGYGYCNKHYIRFKKYGNPLWVNGKEEVV